jgi:uncharacterized LabA/DUF88 family protein
MKKKILVQFDGSNFYNKVKRMDRSIHLTNFNYLSFAQKIAKTTTLKAIYYVGEIRQYEGNRKSERLFNSQQSLFMNLRKQNFEIKLGYLLMSNGKYHEKGVDVQIAVDLVRGAIKNEYDICYLISSDTDLLPAIKTARDEGKKIIYVAFADYISRALLKNCSSYIVVTRKDFG